MGEATTMQQNEALVESNGDKNLQENSLTYLPKWSDTYRQVLIINEIFISNGIVFFFFYIYNHIIDILI